MSDDEIRKANTAWTLAFYDAVRGRPGNLESNVPVVPEGVKTVLDKMLTNAEADALRSELEAAQSRVRDEQLKVTQYEALCKGICLTLGIDPTSSADDIDTAIVNLQDALEKRNRG